MRHGHGTSIFSDDGWVEFPMYNTPPTYAWYIAGLAFEWLKKKGGLKAMAELNERKAKKLCAYIVDSTAELYKNPVELESRSWMNIPLTLNDATLDEEFPKGAKAARHVQLKGHPCTGALRRGCTLVHPRPPFALVACVVFFCETTKDLKLCSKY